jgi:ankyrin repeat protein
MIILGALSGQLERIVDALGPNFFGHVGGGPPGTLLHHAAWVGDPRIVSRLIERGADPISRSGADYDTPVAWAVLGSQHDALPDRDYVAVVEALVAAGAELEERFTEVAQGPLADWIDREISPGGEQSSMP